MMNMLTDSHRVVSSVVRMFEVTAIVVGLAFVLAFSTRPVLADPLPVEAIVQALLPERAGPVTRSMSRSTTRGISIEGELPPELDLPRISLVVNFEFDSARLTNDGFITLQALALALRDERLSGMVFQVGGHTDDVGTPQYNQELSLRRARAVAEHLSNFYEISPDRLKPVGYGETQLAVPGDPKAAANRRVEIINTQPLTS